MRAVIRVIEFSNVNERVGYAQANSERTVVVRDDAITVEIQSRRLEVSEVKCHRATSKS